MEIWNIVWEWANQLNPVPNEFAIRKLVAQIEAHIHPEREPEKVVEAKCECGAVIHGVVESKRSPRRICDDCWLEKNKDFFPA